MYLADLATLDRWPAARLDLLGTLGVTVAHDLAVVLDMVLVTPGTWNTLAPRASCWRCTSVGDAEASSITKTPSFSPHIQDHLRLDWHFKTTRTYQSVAAHTFEHRARSRVRHFYSSSTYELSTHHSSHSLRNASDVLS